MNKDRTIVAILSFAGFLFSFSIILSCITVSAESFTSTASVVVPEACTMTSINDIPHMATLSPNTYSGASGSDYENGIGKTTLSVVCNDDNGFSIYAIGFTGNSYESENHTKLIGNTTGNTISTKAYASGDTTSNWSMKLTKIIDSTVSYNPTNLTVSTGYDDWHAIPDTYTKVAQYKANTGSSTTDNTLGVKLEATYAAFIAQNQPADTYVGQVKYTMVHPYNNEPIQPRPTTAGKICYYANAYDSEGTMGCQSISASDTSAMLFAPNFSRHGYGFAGWSDQFDYATNSEAHLYGPQESISFTAGQYTGSSSGLSLYAVWIKSAGSFQDSNQAVTVCNSLTQATANSVKTLANVSALTDNRDNQTYTIAKLADNKCWMVENLRLSDTHQEGDNIVPTILTVTNTNNPLNDGATVTLKHNYTDVATFNTLSPSSNVAYNATTAPEGWCQLNNAECFDQSRLYADNTSNRATNPTTNNSRLYGYGNHYNWYSATAGRGVYSTDNASATGDICPVGWHLPKGGYNSSNEYWAYIVTGLNNGIEPVNVDSGRPNYSGAEEAGPIAALLRAYPNNFVYSGYIDGTMLRRGQWGEYWTSRAAAGHQTFYFSFHDTSVNPGTDAIYRASGYDGRAVRCIKTSN